MLWKKTNCYSNESDSLHRHHFWSFSRICRCTHIINCTNVPLCNTWFLRLTRICPKWHLCLKAVSGKVIVDKKGIKDSWKEYMEREKWKMIQWSVDLIEGLNCWNMLWKWWKGSLNTEFGSRLRHVKCSSDLWKKENFSVKGKKLYFGFMDLEKSFWRFRREKW